MATSSKPGFDYFGTFLDSLQKARQGHSEDADPSKQILKILSDGPRRISHLLGKLGESVTVEVMEVALQRLERLGMITLADEPEGKVVSLTEDGRQAVRELIQAGG